MTTQAVASLVDYLEASARQFADRPAIVDPAGWSVTYRELDDNADRVAGFLVSAGVRPGDRVGVIVPKGIAALTAFFGIMKARAAYVPADYTAPVARNRAILSDCAVRVAFLTTACAAILDPWTDAPPSCVVFLDDGPLPAPTGESRICRWPEAISHAPARLEGRDRHDLAYILYTSGSTGVPKGVNGPDCSMARSSAPLRWARQRPSMASGKGGAVGSALSHSDTPRAPSWPRAWAFAS